MIGLETTCESLHEISDSFFKINIKLLEETYKLIENRLPTSVASPHKNRHNNAFQHVELYEKILKTMTTKEIGKCKLFILQLSEKSVTCFWRQPCQKVPQRWTINLSWETGGQYTSYPLEFKKARFSSDYRIDCQIVLSLLVTFPFLTVSDYLLKLLNVAIGHFSCNTLKLLS